MLMTFAHSIYKCFGLIPVICKCKLNMSESQIVQFFTGKTVFLTGATGFLGKLLLDRLLRVCGVGMVYVLVRQKKGKAEADRYKEIFDVPMFEPLKRDCPDYLDRLHMITGDCALENLGISEDNWQILFEETHVVIHCAATIRFDQALRTAYNINIRATRDLLHAAKRMKHLQSFIHVSTAYTNCVREDIDEIIYKPPVSDQQLDQFLKTFEDDAHVAGMTPSVMAGWPNTYSFTKFVGEEMVARIGKVDGEKPMPLAIVRPSIVMSTVKEPIPGWIDNFYGTIGVTVGVAAGLLRSLHCVPDNRADMVPADYTVNAILTAAWVTSFKNDKEVQVYNYVSAEDSISWKIYMNDAITKGSNYVLSKTLWRMQLTLNKWEWKHNMYVFFLHTVPAHIVDFICKLLGKPQRLVEGYQKIHKFSEAINYFTLRQWNFKHEKMTGLCEYFNEADRKLFDYRMKNLDWDSYMYDLLKGGRTYLVKEPMSTLPAALKRYQKLVILHWTLVSALVLLFAYIVYQFYSMFCT